MRTGWGDWACFGGRKSDLKSDFNAARAFRDLKSETHAARAHSATSTFHSQLWGAKLRNATALAFGFSSRETRHIKTEKRRKPARNARGATPHHLRVLGNAREAEGMSSKKVLPIHPRVFLLPRHGEVSSPSGVRFSRRSVNAHQEKQRDFYSGKKKRHTLKSQVVIETESLKVVCTAHEKGKVHDFQLFGESRVKLFESIELMADKGYQGIHAYSWVKLHP